MMFYFVQFIYALTVAQAPPLLKGFKLTDSFSFMQSLHNIKISNFLTKQISILELSVLVAVFYLQDNVDCSLQAKNYVIFKNFFVAVNNILIVRIGFFNFTSKRNF